MFPLHAVWFKQGHWFSAIPQALFPFNSLDVVLSLGLCGSVRGIIYCLFSKANVQAWHIPFAEYISLLKYDSFFVFLLCFTLCGEAVSGACSYCEFLGDNNLTNVKYCALCVCEDGRRRHTSMHSKQGKFSYDEIPGYKKRWPLMHTYAFELKWIWQNL